MPGVEAGFAETGLDGNFWGLGLDDHHGKTEFPDGVIRIIATQLSGCFIEHCWRYISFTFDRC